MRIPGRGAFPPPLFLSRNDTRSAPLTARASCDAPRGNDWRAGAFDCGAIPGDRVLPYREALHVQQIRDRFFARLEELVAARLAELRAG